MKNTNENISVNTGMLKTGSWKKVTGAVFSTAVLLLVDFLIIYTLSSSEDGINLADKKKLFLILLGNVIFVIFLVFGEKLSKRMQSKSFFKIADGVILVITPPVMLVFVQMISWLTGFRGRSVSTFTGLVKRVLSMKGFYIFTNLIIYYLLLGVLILIFRKIKTASVVFCYLVVILVMINYFVMEFRGEPFVVLDIVGMGTAAEVVGEYEFKIPLMLGIPIVYSIAFAQFLSRFQTLELGKKSKKNFAARMGVLAVLAAAVIVSFLPIMHKLEPVSLWNINKEYKRKGYIYTLTRETQYIYIEEPDGYSVEKAEEYANEIEEKKDDSAAASDPETITPKNIIMIMNESLTDFESIGEVKSNMEILPYIRSLDKNVKHGLIHVPTFGAGTARSEYEALTGNSMSFLPSGSVPYQLYIRDPEYGMADILKAQGYYTIAMHPNKAHNWNRASVYPSMGFDEFISLENWGDEHQELVREYVSDKATFEKLISVYEDKDPDEKLFTFCVTMQNHGGYTVSSRGSFDAEVKLNYDKKYPLAETYLSLARESDSAFKELLEYFEKVDEPTMIVMFGDHWPKIEEDFLTQVLGANRMSLDLVDSQKYYTTPYVIWTNYPSETVEEDFSSNYLGSYVMKLAGLEMPGYNQFLMDLKEQLPIIGVGAVCDKDGNWYATDDLPDNYQKLMDEYDILEYNNQFEKKTILENLFTLNK